MNHLTAEFIEECKARLLETKAELLNRLSMNKQLYAERDFRGDEADQTVSQLQENQYLTALERFRHQILEIESALARIAQGRYGICEETDEPIEKERLLAIPWTRLSIEGAEIQEASRRRFAR